MAEANSAEIAAKLGRLRANYLLHLAAQVNALHLYCQNERRGALTEADRTTLLGALHKIAGSSGTFGYPELSERAQALHDHLVAEQTVEHGAVISQVRSFCKICQETVGAGDKALLSVSPAPAADNTNRAPILIVDDDPVMRVALRALLEDMGPIIEGKSGAEAIELMQKCKPALVLLDDIMPGGLTGIQALERVKQDPALSEIPIIMVTASHKEHEVTRGLKAGAADYITKPFEAETLRAVVQKILARKKHAIWLVLDQTALAQTLAARLAMLNCEMVDGPQGTAPLIIVASAVSPAIHEALSAPGARTRLLLLANAPPDVGAAQCAQITRLSPLSPAEEIIKHIGRMIRG